MKFTFDKAWLLSRAAEEDKDRTDIAAGALHLDLLPPVTGTPKQENHIPAIGRLVSLSRRKRGWSVEDLAAAARIAMAEAIRIEHDLNYVPGPRTVYQLSTTLGLPRDRMLQLSGNMVVRDTQFGEEAVRFAARSESVEKLTREEQYALEEFVKFLSKTK